MPAKPPIIAFSCGQQFIRMARLTKLPADAARTEPYPDGIDDKIEPTRLSPLSRGALSQTPVSPFNFVPCGHFGLSSSSILDCAGGTGAGGGLSSAGVHCRTTGPWSPRSSSSLVVTAALKMLLSARTVPLSDFGMPILEEAFETLSLEPLELSNDALAAWVLPTSGDGIAVSAGAGLPSKRTAPAPSGRGAPTLEDASLDTSGGGGAWVVAGVSAPTSTGTSLLGVSA